MRYIYRSRAERSRFREFDSNATGALALTLTFTLQAKVLGFEYKIARVAAVAASAAHPHLAKRAF
jgi:hypothetical protein